MRTMRSSAVSGFTLIEVMVALAIVAVALFAALRASGAAVANSTDYRDRLLARWVAGNLIAEAQLQRPLPPIGVAEGEDLYGGQRFVWTRRVSETPNPRFRRVDIEIRAVAEATTAGDRLAELSGFVVQE